MTDWSTGKRIHVKDVNGLAYQVFTPDGKINGCAPGSERSSLMNLYEMWNCSFGVKMTTWSLALTGHLAMWSICSMAAVCRCYHKMMAPFGSDASQLITFECHVPCLDHAMNLQILTLEELCPSNRDSRKLFSWTGEHLFAFSCRNRSSVAGLL